MEIVVNIINNINKINPDIIIIIIIIIIIRTNYIAVYPADFPSEKINIQNYFQRIWCTADPSSHFRSMNCAW